MKDSEAVAERLATEGSYVPALNSSTLQNVIYSQLMLLQQQLPKKNCYTITVSPTSNTIRSMVSDVTQLKKLMGYIINSEPIKKCFYTIELSSNGKLHAHGVMLTKASFRYRGLNTKYPGVQIYVEQYKPDPNGSVLYHEESIPPKCKPRQSRSRWIKYISKQPLQLVEYTHGKNYCLYRCVSSC